MKYNTNKKQINKLWKAERNKKNEEVNGIGG